MPFREEKRYRVLRRGEEVARVEGASHYTFDELALLNGPRTINFCNASRELVSIVPAEPGDIITDCMIGFVGYAGRQARQDAGEAIKRFNQRLSLRVMGGSAWHRSCELQPCFSQGANGGAGVGIESLAV